MFSGLFYTSINQLLSSGPSDEIQDNVSYRGKFMSAVRLWRKRDEEKRVWDLKKKKCFTQLSFILGIDAVYSGKLTVMLTTLRCYSRSWLCLRRPWTRKTSSSIPAEWLSDFERTTYLVWRKNWRKDKAFCQRWNLRLWLTSWKKR